MADIRIANITKHFGAFHALKGIDLHVKDQEFMVLLGASGCGKSTLLRAIAGLESADTGTVHVGEERIDHLQAKDRRLSMVFGLRMQKRPDSDVRQKVQRVAELVHLEALLHRYSGQLSGGQRQRVALARALAVEPRVILMDEPLSNLDALLRLEMRAELKTILAQSKTTTIYVTHDQVEAMSLADRIAIMNQGVIVQCDTPLEIYRNPATTFVAGFIGNPPMNFVPARAIDDGVFEALGLQLRGPRGHAALTLGVRPEDLQPANEGFGVEVAVVEPLGAHTLVTAFVGEPRQVFRAALDSTDHHQAGQRLKLMPALPRVRWYDSAGQMIQGD
jgi:multiple sugar transport system ATP-binding protein